MQPSDMSLNGDVSDRITLKQIIETYLREREGFDNDGDPEQNGLNSHVQMVLYDMGLHRPQAPISWLGDEHSRMLTISALADIPTISTILRVYLDCLYKSKHGRDQSPSPADWTNETDDMLLSMRVDELLCNPFLPTQTSTMVSIESIVRVVLTLKSPLNSAFEKSAEQDDIVDKAVDCLLRGTWPSFDLQEELSVWFQNLSLMTLFREYCVRHEILRKDALYHQLTMMNSISFARPRI